jgi:hypothetical protein
MSVPKMRTNDEEKSMSEKHKRPVGRSGDDDMSGVWDLGVELTNLEAETVIAQIEAKNRCHGNQGYWCDKAHPGFDANGRQLPPERVARILEAAGKENLS